MMTEVVREIRKLTFADQAEMNEVIATQQGWWSSQWQTGNSSVSNISYTNNWDHENCFDVNLRGVEHFGMFENGQLNYIKVNRYFNHNVFEKRQPIYIAPFSTSTTISRRQKNVATRIDSSGNANPFLNIIELQNYAMINGSEAVGCNVIVIANPGDPRPNESVDVGNGKIWKLDSEFGDTEIQSRRSTHYRRICIEEVFPEEKSEHAWIRSAALGSIHTHKVNIFMYLRHNFES